ncbi:MAG: DNA polymerase III subunit beta [Polyangiaceae bacterium]
MEITLAKKDLLRLVTRMQGVAERKSTMPALSSVLLAVEADKTLRLAATDLYLSLVGRIPVDVTKPGSVAVPAKDLFERIKMMPDGPIQIIAVAGAATTLKAKGSARRYTLRGMPGEDFPPLPSPQEGAASLSLEVAVLKDLIDKTYFSISTDETRAHLNSALFEWEGATVRMVTTDGHRLSKYEATVEGKLASATMLIPLKAIMELRGLCDEALSQAAQGGNEGANREVTITQSGASAFFQFGSMTFSVKLVDAQFPPYGQVVPQSSDKAIKASRAELASALRAVSIAASERTGGVKVQIGAGSMRISSESPDSGDGFDELPVDYDGAGVTIGFNAKYFLDVLGALDSDTVVLSLNGELDPAVLRPGQGEADGKGAKGTSATNRDFLAVIMPMRI